MPISRHEPSRLGPIHCGQSSARVGVAWVPSRNTAPRRNASNRRRDMNEPHWSKRKGRPSIRIAFLDLVHSRGLQIQQSAQRLRRFFWGKLAPVGRETARIVIARPSLSSPGAVDALRGMRHGLQAGGLDVPAAGVALTVAAAANPLQRLVNLGELAAFHLGELASQLHLLGGERGIDFVTDAGVVHVLKRTNLSRQGASQRLATTDELLLDLTNLLVAYHGDFLLRSAQSGVSQFRPIRLILS